MSISNYLYPKPSGLGAIWGAAMTENCKVPGASPHTPLAGFTASPVVLHDF